MKTYTILRILFLLGICSAFLGCGTIAEYHSTPPTKAEISNNPSLGYKAWARKHD